MINKEMFFKKHQNLESQFLEKITSTVIDTFPKKMDEMKLHMENLNYAGVLYFADLIEDSYAFIYGDVELGKLLRRTHDAAIQRDRASLQQVYPLLLEAAGDFLTDVEQLNKDHFAKE